MRKKLNQMPRPRSGNRVKATSGRWLRLLKPYQMRMYERSIRHAPSVAKAHWSDRL